MVRVVADVPPGLQGKHLVEQIIDPEINTFEAWFSTPDVGNGRLTKYEREILRAYLYHKIARSPQG